jgi:hypothetical protein
VHRGESSSMRHAIMTDVQGVKGKSSEQQWNRLQHEYQQAVEAAYPNPERCGCPAMVVLRELATRSARFEDLEKDSHWKHVIRCAPCYDEFLKLRESCRP